MICAVKYRTLLYVQLSTVQNHMAIKTERLDMRLSAEHKELLERAAAITGQAVTSFAVSNLLEKAREVIEQHTRTVLGREDHERFLEILNSDDEPAPALLKAAERRARYGE